LTFVDGVSAIGGMPFRFDEWEVDVALTASQKCLMSAPGLSFVVLSERATATASTATLPRSYWDFREIREHVMKALPDTAGTPPVHVMLQVAEALRAMHEEGLDQVYARHDAMGRWARARVSALGLTLQCQGFQRFAPTLTAVATPVGVAPEDLRSDLEARGVFVAEALGPFAASAFRIGHMGDIRQPDLERTFEAIGAVLTDRAPTTRAPRGR
jgi:aspartate aminotransferase-like enzyme